MPFAAPQSRPNSCMALASFFLALVSPLYALLSFRDFSEEVFLLTFLGGCLSLVLNVLAFKGLWQGRVRSPNLLPIIAVHLALLVMALPAMLIPWVIRSVLEAESRSSRAANNVKQLALALDAYENEHGTLPTDAVYSKDGTPLLSWRVLVLPYLEQERLFEQFKLDEPWDSPHNRPLLSRMPRVYLSPQGTSTSGPHTTNYQVFVGPGTAFEGNRDVSLADFPDGTENTILLVEAAKAVPWTKPEDLPYSPDRPLPEIGGFSRKRFYAGFADGTVHRLGKKLPEKILRALITRNGGEMLNPNWEDIRWDEFP